MNNVQRTLIIGLVLLGTLLWNSSPALADSVTYTETDVASGSLGAASFSNALVTITLVGDTSTLTTDPVSGEVQVFGPTTVTVAGIGTFAFTDSLDVFDTPLEAGIQDLGLGFDVMDTSDPAFANYLLMGNFGAITNSSIVNQYVAFGTSGGDFVLTSDSGTSTFTATAVPEPASLFLLGVGLSGLVCASKKKARTATV